MKLKFPKTAKKANALVRDPAFVEDFAELAFGLIRDTVSESVYKRMEAHVFHRLSPPESVGVDKLAIRYAALRAISQAAERWNEIRLPERRTARTR